jgi:hypothetical protein
MKKTLLIAVIILVCSPISSQIKPEIELGMKYNSRNNILTTHDKKPIGLIVGFGFIASDKWSYGFRINHFKTESSYSKAKHYNLEIETKRLFNISSRPKFSIDVGARLGYYIADAFIISAGAYMEPYKAINVSANCGASYSLTKHIAIDLSPGLTWYPGKHPRPRIGSFLETGLTFKF